MSIYLRDSNTNRVVKIEMMVHDKYGLSPDWSRDFFNAGTLPYDEGKDEYTVPDVDYCIEQAIDWKEESEDNRVWVTEQKTFRVTFTDGSEKEYRCWDMDLDLGQVICDSLESETGCDIETDGIDFWTEKGDEVKTVAEVEEIG